MGKQRDFNTYLNDCTVLMITFTVHAVLLPLLLRLSGRPQANRFNQHFVGNGHNSVAEHTFCVQKVQDAVSGLFS